MKQKEIEEKIKPVWKKVEVEPHLMRVAEIDYDEQARLALSGQASS